MASSWPVSSWTARSWPTSPCATPRRSADSPRQPGRPRPLRRTAAPSRISRAPQEGAFFVLMITSPHNEKLKTIRKLHGRRERSKLGLFVAEGEDLIEAAEASGWEPEFVLVAGDDPEAAVDAEGRITVDPALLDDASALGSGTRAIGVYPQRWSEPRGELCVYLHGVRDPGNLGTIMRSALAFADGPVILGAHCADPWSPKAVRASMGSIFARPPARAAWSELPGTRIAYVAGAPEAEPIHPPIVGCIG